MPMRLCLLLLYTVLAACAAAPRGPRCSGPLQPINAPAARVAAGAPGP